MNAIETGRAAAVTWRPVAAVTAGLSVVLLAFSGQYGYNVDELYYRLLGTRGAAWGYVDQPPLVPLLVNVSTQLFGDTVTGMRVPAILCAVAVVVLGVLITAELGGTARAQVLSAVCLATSALVLGLGHVFVTSTMDMVGWCGVMLFVLRAVLRQDGRWWLAAGAVCGIAIYSKYVVLLLPVTVLLCMVVTGPRKPLRDKWLYAGIGLGLLIGAPNLAYQLVNDLPQLHMAEVLGAADGPVNRVIFGPSLLLILGPALTPIWIAGLVRLIRDPRLRAVGVAFPAMCVLLVLGGGRPDYAGGFLLALLAAGCVVTEGWMSRASWRRPALVVALALSTALQALVALPVLPRQTLASQPLNSISFNISFESVGWPELADQVSRAHRELPAGDRARAVVLTHNFGEAGALQRYGTDLPAVYSGHNELHGWGPPPESADVVLAVGFEPDELAGSFTGCDEVDRVDNRLEVANSEQGKPIAVCRGLRARWHELWPGYRYLSGT